MLEKGNRANTLHGILLIALFSFAAFYIAGFPIVKRYIQKNYGHSSIIAANMNISLTLLISKKDY